MVLSTGGKIGIAALIMGLLAGGAVLFYFLYWKKKHCKSGIPSGTWYAKGTDNYNKLLAGILAAYQENNKGSNKENNNKNPCKMKGDGENKVAECPNKACCSGKSVTKGSSNDDDDAKIKCK